ncbi:unnamed protein product [Blepharisma stoltei]|uniref:Uncharacterized protein n=1 Tax=Blepharisma stoltei TaxID=1481888 RepID=A0AAU9JLP0_9CILI|nr:unnamed protein product [Blepharisma stoltei]
MISFHSRTMRGFGSSDELKQFLLSAPTIEQILSFSTIEEEVQSNNQSLMSYLSNDHIRYLITLITEEPLDDSNRDRAYKFPLIASLFFGTDQLTVLDFFYEDKTLLDLLFNFLNKEEDLNFLLAGYFAKAFDSLISRDCDALLQYVFTNSFHTKMLKHLYSQSIADVIFKTVAAYNCEEDYLSERLGILEELINSLSNTNPAVAMNVEYVMEKVINDKSINLYVALYEYLSSEAITEKIFRNLENEYTWIARSSAKILKNLLKQYLEEIKDSGEDVPDIVGIFEKNLEFMKNTLEKPKDKKISSQFCREIEAYSEEKIIVIDILTILCTVENYSLWKTIVSLKFIETITAHFKTYIWNSTLHTAYLNLLYAILTGESEELIQDIFNAKIPDMVLDQAIVPDEEIDGISIRKGHIGHIYKIANLLKTARESQTVILNFFNHVEGWYEFESHVLSIYNEIESVPLGNRKSSAAPNSANDIDILQDLTQGIAFDMPSFLNQNPFDIKEVDDPMIINQLEEQGEIKSSNIFMETIPKDNTFAKLMETEFMDNNFWKISKIVDEVPELG